jgi:hypothetical protein
VRDRPERVVDELVSVIAGFGLFGLELAVELSVELTNVRDRRFADVTRIFRGTSKGLCSWLRPCTGREQG